MKDELDEIINNQMPRSTINLSMTDYIQMINAFSDIYFEEIPHKYTDSLGTKYTSVTTFIGKMEADKDWDEIALKASKNPNNINAFGKPVDRIRAEWKYSGEYACALGTMVHSVMELGWQNKEFYPDEKILEKYPGMKEDFDWRKQKAKSLLKRLKEVYVPIKNEFIVYDAEWKLCGTIDFLAYNKVKNCISILDWKTNKKWDYSNRYQRMKDPFENLDDCNIKHYELQLNTYKAILEKHTNIKVDEMILIQIPNQVQNKALVHRCNDHQELLLPYLNSLK